MKESSSLTESAVVVFSSFPELHEDIMKLILSFVADAPLENWFSSGICPANHKPIPTNATLTQTLPFVNKAFRDFSLLDYFWEPALHRQLERQDSLRHHWESGLRRLLPPSFVIDDETDVLQTVLDHFEEKSFRKIYKTILTSHIRSVYPIFIMPCQLRLGEMYGLHLFEPRYRTMVRDLLDSCGNPQEAGRGGQILDGMRDGVRQPPLLVHACLGSTLGPGEMACLVQLVWCRTYEYGTADVQLFPVAWVRLDKVWVRPSSGHLYYAKATRV